MGRKMREFLAEAARAERGKGIMVPALARRIAHKAVTDGHGVLITAPLMVFIINDTARTALGETS